MNSTTSAQVLHDFPIFKVFSDGRVEKVVYAEKIPPLTDPKTGVQAKDVTISHEVSARIYLPKLNSPDEKLPILLYIHGGGFAIESAFSPLYSPYVSTLASLARVICVSVEYRLAPENPVTDCYDDCWTALHWIASQGNGNGVEPWLNEHGDFKRLFVAGDSAGGNLTYNLIVQAGKSKLPTGVKLVGAVLVHPYFVGPGDRIDDMWMYICPNNIGLTDPRIKPDASDMKLIPAEKLLVLVAEKDEFDLRDRGFVFVEEVKKSGWSGKVDILESPGEGHCFHLHRDLSHPATAQVMNKFISFINGI